MSLNNEARGMVTACTQLDTYLATQIEKLGSGEIAMAEQSGFLAMLEKAARIKATMIKAAILQHNLEKQYDEPENAKPIETREHQEHIAAELQRLLVRRVERERSD